MYTPTHIFVYKCNKHTSHFYLTFLPTFSTHQLPEGRTSLQQQLFLDGKALISHRGSCTTHLQLAGLCLTLLSTDSTIDKEYSTYLI